MAGMYDRMYLGEKADDWAYKMLSELELEYTDRNKKPMEVLLEHFRTTKFVVRVRRIINLRLAVAVSFKNKTKMIFDVVLHEQTLQPVAATIPEFIMQDKSFILAQIYDEKQLLEFAKPYVELWCDVHKAKLEAIRNKVRWMYGCKYILDNQTVVIRC